MAGLVTVTFKTTADSETEVRELLNRAQQEIDGGYYFTEGSIAHINFVSFEREETISLTREELSKVIQDAVDKALAGNRQESGDRPSGLDD